MDIVMWILFLIISFGCGLLVGTVVVSIRVAFDEKNEYQRGYEDGVAFMKGDKK